MWGTWPGNRYGQQGEELKVRCRHKCIVKVLRVCQLYLCLQRHIWSGLIHTHKWFYHSNSTLYLWHLMIMQTTSSPTSEHTTSSWSLIHFVGKVSWLVWAARTSYICCCSTLECPACYHQWHQMVFIFSTLKGKHCNEGLTLIEMIVYIRKWNFFILLLNYTIGCLRGGLYLMSVAFVIAGSGE